MDKVFKGDGGVTYLLRDMENGGLAITGKYGTMVGVGNRIEITGKLRNHGVLGLAQRAILTIDFDGEGDEVDVRGVLLNQTALPV